MAKLSRRLTDPHSFVRAYASGSSVAWEWRPMGAGSVWYIFTVRLKGVP